MLLCIPSVLTPDEVADFRRLLDAADWTDGNATAGPQSSLVKHNQQLAESLPVARELGDRVIDAIGRSALFASAALPLKTFPPLFNRYGVGDGFGAHIDNAIRPVRGTHTRVRTDLSCTLFLSSPDEYDGGELVIEDAGGSQSVKCTMWRGFPLMSFLMRVNRSFMFSSLKKFAMTPTIRAVFPNGYGLPSIE